MIKNTEHEPKLEAWEGSEQSDPTTEDNKPLTDKQKAKQEQQAKKYWSSMISRQEAYEMVNSAIDSMNQRLQLLMIQNRTLLEVIEAKGVATQEEINEHSKVIMESIFGPIPEGDKQDDEPQE